MRTRTTGSRVLFGIALLTGLGSIAFVPSASFAGCTIRCETCEVNLDTGTAKCSNCTLTDCQPQQE
jgi:hypothetical protein